MSSNSPNESQQLPPIGGTVGYAPSEIDPTTGIPYPICSGCGKRHKPPAAPNGVKPVIRNKGSHPALPFGAYDPRVIWGAAIGGIIGGTITQLVEFFVKLFR